MKLLQISGQVSYILLLPLNINTLFSSAGTSDSICLTRWRILTRVWSSWLSGPSCWSRQSGCILSRLNLMFFTLCCTRVGRKHTRWKVSNQRLHWLYADLPVDEVWQAWTSSGCMLSSPSLWRLDGMWLQMPEEGSVESLATESPCSNDKATPGQLEETAVPNMPVKHKGEREWVRQLVQETTVLTVWCFVSWGTSSKTPRLKSIPFFATSP